MKKFFSLHSFLIALFAVLVCIFGYLKGIPFLDLMELKTIDLRFESRGEISPGPDVVLAVIDEKSINKEGKWVWPRSKIAKLVTKLSKAGTKVIAFDIGFLEPDDKRIIQAINKIENKVNDLHIQHTGIKDYLENLKTQVDNDKLLADAIRNSRSRVVLGYFFQMERAGLEHVSKQEISIHQKNAAGSKYKIVRYKSGDAQNTPLIEAIMPQSNIETISSASKYSGFFNMMPDKDGVVRWMPAVFKCNEILYAPLSLITASAYLDAPMAVKIAGYGVEEVQIGRLSIPTDELGRVLINYRGKEKTFPHISITDILNGEISDNILKDKIVMVGATAVGIFDLRVTPFGNVFPGLEIHANVVDAILSKDFMYQPGWAAIFDIMAIMAAGIFLAIVLPKTGGIGGAIAASSLFITYIFLCQYLFSSKGLILNLVYPLTVIIAVYMSITLYKYFTETRQKRFIKNAFSTYLAPAVVKQLIESPEKLVLGGEQRVITAFFSDVQGFTSISENLTPHDLVELLNEFLTEMTDVILRHKGTVDKFEGDAIIAFFGAPNELENQEQVACNACIDMQKRLSELRIKWKTEGKPELKMRIGLCTGQAVVGNMGSKTRMDYTMMGDAVNTAARLEGVTKIYGIYTLVSDSTFKATNDSVIAREIDSINVVGKKEPITVYQLLGYPDDIDTVMHETLDH